MITKTGIDYSTNSDLSPATFSGNIEENGQVSSITIPNSPQATRVYVKAYCIDEGQRIESETKNYLFEEYFYIKNEYAGQNTITLKNTYYQSTPSGNSVEYSKDKSNWTTININSTGYDIVLEEGESVWFRNNNGGWNIFHNVSQYSTNFFSGSQIYSAGGNLMSLVKYTNMSGHNISQGHGVFSRMFSNGTGTYNTTLVSVRNLVFPEQICDQCYTEMFDGCTSLVDTPRTLPATTLSSSCYERMFNGCTSLTTAPVLPATTLANYCYYSMFYGCISLTTAPALPATTLADYCYSSMFNRCTSLTTAPVLPATTLAQYCYNSMFYGCTSLTTAPVLPATTLAQYCYDSMFSHCTSLTTAPVLPATTLANYCYHFMFNSCTSLTTAPVLPATTLAQYCYDSMFIGCENLNSCTLYATRPQGQTGYSTSLQKMFNGVSPTGTLYNYGNYDINWKSTNNYFPNLPSGWTIVTT